MYYAEFEEKIDAALNRWQNVEKQKMFGGVGYLLKGNMCFGIHKDNLIVRIDKGQRSKASRTGMCSLSASRENRWLGGLWCRKGDGRA
jgi:TfoX/Sxy family transcriptional regulator of competence genes